MVYAARVHVEGDYGTTTEVVSLHGTPEGARKALVARLEAIASERCYRAAGVWESPTLAEVLELDAFNIVRMHTDWSGDIKAMQVLP